MVNRGDGADPFAGLKDPDEKYRVYDSHYEKIGEVNDLVLSEDGQVLYVGVGMGFFGTNSTLIPAEIIRINDRRRLIEVSEPAEAIKHAPTSAKARSLPPSWRITCVPTSDWKTSSLHRTTSLKGRTSRKPPLHTPSPKAGRRRSRSSGWRQTAPPRRVLKTRPAETRRNIRSPKNPLASKNPHPHEQAPRSRSVNA